MSGSGRTRGWRLPIIFAGLRIAITLAVVGAVVGEYVGANRGLGALIIATQGSFDTPLMFAVFAYLTAIGIILYTNEAFADGSSTAFGYDGNGNLIKAVQTSVSGVTFPAAIKSRNCAFETGPCCCPWDAKNQDRSAMLSPSGRCCGRVGHKTAGDEIGFW